MGRRGGRGVIALWRKQPGQRVRVKLGVTKVADISLGSGLGDQRSGV